LQTNSISATQTTTGWSDQSFPNSVQPQFSATGQSSVTSQPLSRVDASCKGTSEIDSGYTFAFASPAWASIQGYESGSFSTPTAGIVIDSGACRQQVLFHVIPQLETPSNSTGAYGTVGMIVAANTGFQATKTVIQWAGFVRLYTYRDIAPGRISTFASAWAVVIKISSNGKYIVYVSGAQPFRTSPLITVNAITVTPILATGNPTGFSMTGDFRAVSPASGAIGAQTDTLALSASVQTNAQPCGVGIATALGDLDDALFS
jgi:hypothetical protein